MAGGVWEGVVNETFEEALQRIRSAPYEASIRHHRSWGPWAWSFELGVGLCVIGDPSYGTAKWHAWTADGIERKARRVIAKRERWDQRHFPEWPRHKPCVLHWLNRASTA